MQFKLDELIRVHRSARNGLLCLEDRTEDELSRVSAGFAALSERREAGERTTRELGEEHDAVPLQDGRREGADDLEDCMGATR